MKRTTQQWLDEIARLTGRPRRLVLRGGTEPKMALTDIAYAFHLQVDTELPKTKLAEAICRAGGESWDRTCDSDATPSGGGGTITTEGQERLLRAARQLKRHFE